MEDDEVKKFVGEYKPKAYLHNPDGKVSIGPLDMPAYYMEHKYQQAEAMRNAKKVILEVSEEFAKITGRKYGLFEEYKMDDAEAAIVIIGSSAGTAKATIEELRAEGKKVGLIKIRSFRPFPVDEIVEALKNVKAIAVMDKTDSFNAAGGPLFQEVTSAMYGKTAVPAVNYIYGLGGRDVTTKSIREVFEHVLKIAETGKVDKVYNYLSVKE